MPRRSSASFQALFEMWEFSLPSIAGQRIFFAESGSAMGQKIWRNAAFYFRIYAKFSQIEIGYGGDYCQLPIPIIPAVAPT
jgi:hypothetical protein